MVRIDKTSQAFIAEVLRWYPTQILEIFHARFHRSLLKRKNPSVKEYAQFFSQQFLLKESFDELMGKLSETVQRVFADVVWHGGAFFLDIAGGKEVSKYGRFNFYSSFIKHNPDFSVFYLDDDYYLRLPDTIRRHCKRYLDKPSGYKLLAHDNVIHTQRRFSEKDDILAQLKTFYEFIKLNGIAVYYDNLKLPKSHIRSINKICKIKEFFSDKPFPMVRTTLLLTFLVSASRLLNTEKCEADVIKALFSAYMQGSVDFPESKLLLTHLKIELYRNYKHHMKLNKKRDGFLTILKSLPLEKWVSIENIIAFTQYRDLELPLYAPDFAANYIYARVKYRAEKPSPYSGSYWGRLYLKDVQLYRELYVQPLLKAMFFLFASFNLVDLAYDESFSITTNQDMKFECPYNGLRYARLNRLGAYVLGLLDEYISSSPRKTSRIVLSKSLLIATVSSENDVKYAFLRRVGKEISPCAFHIDYASFLKKCRCAQDVEETLENFRGMVEDPLPEIWSEFLAHVKSRINPFKDHEEMVVMTLSHDEELFETLTTDPYLRTTVLKVENFKVAIPYDSLKQVAKQLKKYGYFVDDLQEYINIYKGRF